MGKFGDALFSIESSLTHILQALSFGVEADLIRFSVGLEDTAELLAVFRRALEAIP